MDVLAEECEFRIAQGNEVRDALLLALSNLASDSRAALVDSIRRQENSKLDPLTTLWIAKHQDQIVSAGWAQPQSGNAATLWPPVSNRGCESQVASTLLREIVIVLDQAGISYSQLLLEDGNDQRIESLEENGFQFVAKLEYLGRKTSSSFSHDSANKDSRLSFEPFKSEDRQWLSQIVEATYIDTLDCPSLAGLREIEDTLEGYRSTGNYRPENWFCIRMDGDVVGILILAELDLGENYELVYMGLLPQYRGEGLGNEIVQFACSHAAAAGADQIMVAVDTVNHPAQKAYVKNGFVSWANRWAYVRSLPEQ